ncbi:glycosyltransferase [Acidocella aromatica]|uniref:Glycosyltransferase involved in cell wall biosynthesis n=1 Tax=Acidocella aromatica TaxID=1303579 RepID=A0A840VF58_9PROT|nr:glycosyltransferase [Acidocella aromatica]MBB5374468.1 glycosyltransferase involved in cell wall biosynthesis [Acidocella aromatica]
MRTLVWHWGRRGAGPIFAARLAAALNTPLSLAAGAEILAAPNAPRCDWREPTYETRLGYIVQRLASPFLRARTEAHLRRLAPDFALCAMPALLDARMITALNTLGIGYGVIVHDAAPHPGDALSFRVLDQARLLRGAKHLFCLSSHVEQALRGQGFGTKGQTLTKLWHPPLDLAADVPAARPTARPRILYFGRLLPYKGLDLLANALEFLGNNRPFELRVCGDGPNTPALERLTAMPGVAVERRWFAEGELPGLLAWADALVLPYREASQSGVAALALAAGRRVLATSVGGLPEQLGGQPGAILCAPNAPAIAQGLLALSRSLAQPAAATIPPLGWDEMAQTILSVAGPGCRGAELPAN